MELGALHEHDIYQNNHFVLRILTNDLIYDIIFLAVDPCTLVRLARTCRTAHAAAHSHIARTFNINTHLARYFQDPLAFRSLQAATGTLISGSSALQFLDRTFYPDADLDLYCFHKQRSVVGSWLLQQGYRFVPNRRQAASFDTAVDQPRLINFATRNDAYNMRAVSGVYTFTKAPSNPDCPDAELKVQLIVAQQCPMAAIFQFHSTVVLNMISYSHAYALYPRATFHDRVSLRLLKRTEAHRPIEAKYAQRGWRFLTVLPPASPSPKNKKKKKHAQHSAAYFGELNQARQQLRAQDRSIIRAFPRGKRWIHDKHTWVVPLNTAGVELPAFLGDTIDPALPRDPSFVTTWEMVNCDLDVMRVGKEILTDTCASPGLWYGYAIGDPKLYGAASSIKARYSHSSSTLGKTPLSKYCDGELVGYCERMLVEGNQWGKWYPDKHPNEYKTKW